jgi:hypothetical protein
MKKFAIALAGLGIAVTAVPASAQAWQSINARQDRLENRIEQGIRSGALSRNEAVRLRGEFRSLSQLEYRYRRSGGGLSVGERRDLDRRFDQLSSKIRWEKHDRDDRRRR